MLQNIVVYCRCHGSSLLTCAKPHYSASLSAAYVVLFFQCYNQLWWFCGDTLDTFLGLPFASAGLPTVLFEGLMVSLFFFW